MKSRMALNSDAASTIRFSKWSMRLSKPCYWMISADFVAAGLRHG